MIKCKCFQTHIFSVISIKNGFETEWENTVYTNSAITYGQMVSDRETEVKKKSKLKLISLNCVYFGNFKTILYGKQ